MSEQSNRGLACPNCRIRSRPLAARVMDSPTSVKTPSICSSSSLRSVMIATRAFGLFSRIHLASNAMTMLLPLPCLDAEILVRARQFLYSAVEEYEVMHQLDQPRLAAQLEQILVQLEARVVLLVFLPLQEVLLFGTDRAVQQPFGIVAREDELHSAEEPFVEFRPLVGDALADAVAD